jgi:glucose-1-phosphate cytidylyltransferase
MKVVIFAGGIGSRISEESLLKPKPMIEIGGKPILWHIMKIYMSQGFNEFIICLGYKGYMIKEYFVNYFMNNSDITVDVKNNVVSFHQSSADDFKVTLSDTGLDTQTAGRLKRVQPYIGNEEFMLTYGDGVADVDLKKLVDFHQRHGKIATVTSVLPEGRFGAIEMNDHGVIQNFLEKPHGDGHWINGGFFMLKPEVFDYLDADADHQMWEDGPMQKLTVDHQLVAYRHDGFWRCMDALRDKHILEELWGSGNAPWKTWKE